MILEIHPQNPNPRHITQVASVLQQGGIVIYPTSSGYAISTAIGNKRGLNKISKIREISKHHNWTMMLGGLKDIATYAQVTNDAFRLVKSTTPAPITFIFEATKAVHKTLLQKRKTIGIRIDEHPIVQAIIESNKEAIMSASLLMKGYEFYDAFDIAEKFATEVDIIVDAGYCPPNPTTVIDLSQEGVSIIREGAFDIARLK